MKFKLLLIMLLSLFSVHAADQKIEIGVDERLGNKIPLNLQFNDENGNKVVLKDLFKTPTVLSFVYYECPGICTPLMTALAQVVAESDLKPGVQYNIVTVSMNEMDTPKLAADKKKNYLKMIGKNFPADSWRFLTGDSATIKTLTDASGFYFKRDGKEFIHSGTIIFLTEDGVITRYLFPSYTDRAGYSVLPFDFKMAVIETSEGKVVPTVAKMLQYCFSYDPEGKTYVLNLTRVFGAGILLAALVFVVVLVRKPKKNVVTRKEDDTNVK